MRPSRALCKEARASPPASTLVTGPAFAFSSEEQLPVRHECVWPAIARLAWAVRERALRRSDGVWRVAPDAASARLGVRIRRGRMEAAGDLLGLSIGGDTIVLYSSIASRQAQRWVIAHELAHILVQRNTLPRCLESEEWTADWFARELLAPRRLLRAAPGMSDSSAALLFDVDVIHVMLQRMRISESPDVAIHNGIVLCPRCGHRQLLPNCPCRELHAKAAPDHDAWEECLTWPRGEAAAVPYSAGLGQHLELPIS